ncbi:C-type lectin mannose-binding isoform-like [Asterias amurensis]|uniref:C-type lectin mannose-binding isoform-like n=1 Tax=Asterias amurensis TaxID=7602 RepID=UPI003AB6E53C
MALRHFLVVKILLIYFMNGCINATNEVCKTSVGASTQDWIKWGDNFYKVIMEKMQWLEARDACAEMGGVMVTPKSENEGRFLAGITPLPTSGVNHFWINCNDRLVEGTWECDGKTDNPYQPWGSGEPNDYKGREDCGKANSGGIGWGDIPCSNYVHAVCKKPVAVLHL